MEDPTWEWDALVEASQAVVTDDGVPRGWEQVVDWLTDYQTKYSAVSDPNLDAALDHVVERVEWNRPGQADTRPGARTWTIDLEPVVDLYAQLINVGRHKGQIDAIQAILTWAEGEFDDNCAGQFDEDDEDETDDLDQLRGRLNAVVTQLVAAFDLTAEFPNIG
jgi:hypothetical protein